MVELTAFQYTLLSAADDLVEPSGQDIRRHVNSSPFHGSDMNHGRLYPNLDTVVDAGLVEKGEHDRRTNYYEITDEGKAALETRAAYLGATA